jgi:formyltetrahydrofolate deformylase
MPSSNPSSPASSPASPPVSNILATLLVSCRDRTGLVAALSDFVFRNDGNIIDADQHAERETGLFFMRLRWDVSAFRLARPEIAAAMAELAARFDLAWELTYSDVRPKVAVFASKVPHCLYDLLLSHQLGELGGDLVAVVSNHDLLAPVAGHFGVRFQHVAVGAGDKARAEAAQQQLLEELGVDLVVLARYMQILSPAFVARWPGRIINIHHSFLPAFVGAKPYHQAKDRGVKVIGATAHYVTSDLDQGPIIEQDVCRVSHRDDVEDLIQKGRELERQVLTRAVRLHLERRVLVSGNRTIVFG